MPRSDFLSFLFLFTSTFLISCSDLLDGSGINSALRDELNDRGKTKLDPGNPYVAPNAFLAEEAKNSENLKGFLSMKGNPTAISYHEDFFSSPELELFYDDKGEVFKLKQSGKSWIISSPIKSETTEKKDENKGSSLFKEEPPIVTYMDPKLEEARKKASDPSLKSEPVKSAPAKDTPLEKKVEDSEFVDIFHIIEFEGQTLTFIAYWYTGSETNADRIAGINGINKSAPLRLSQSIRIPSYLCLKKDKPTEMDFKNFLAN
jgi:hypothetical protein